MKKMILFCFLLLLHHPILHHPILAKPVEVKILYNDGLAVLEGIYFMNDSVQSQQPGIVIAHQWMGITEYERERARQLSEKGYVVFLADIYGKIKRPKNVQEAKEYSSTHKNNRNLMRRRVNLAVAEIRKLPQTDVNQIAAIGYCFGGTVVLELARSGANVKGVVSFHGGLDTPTPHDAKQIKGQVLVLHGADDPYVPISDVLAFRKEMQDANVNWELTMYGNAVHEFSKAQAGNDPSKGAAYNAQADARSFDAMLAFFETLFSKTN